MIYMREIMRAKKKYIVVILSKVIKKAKEVKLVNIMDGLLAET